MVSVRDSVSWRAGRRRTATLLPMPCVLLVVLRCDCKPKAESARLWLLPVLRCAVGGRSPRASSAEALEAALAWLLELDSPKTRSADPLESERARCRLSPRAEKADALELLSELACLLLAPPGRIGESTPVSSHAWAVFSESGLSVLNLSHV